MSAYGETEVLWPDIKNPATTLRQLSMSDGNSNVRTLAPLALEILVNACLYVVCEDGQGLRAGDILSRNLELTRRHRRDIGNPAEQVFVRYRSVYDARRGIGRVHGRYKTVEIPELATWRMDADWLLRTSWTLHQAALNEEAEFVWVADRRVRRHQGDQDEHKVLARRVFEKVAGLRDTLGRRNFASFPLQLDKADRALQTRAQEVRGIGRRMDWRAVVLEHVLDQLHRECRMIRRAAQDALGAETIFGDARTPQTLRSRALRMRDYGGVLRGIRFRTFTRAFSHIADELEEASDQLLLVATQNSALSLPRASHLLRKVYRSMVLAELHTRLQEILLVASDHMARKAPLSPAQIHLFREELDRVSRQLAAGDAVTGESLGEGFGTDVLPIVSGNAQLALIALSHTEGPDLPTFKEHLKKACDPV